jgi:hypothetical protein
MEEYLPSAQGCLPRPKGALSYRTEPLRCRLGLLHNPFASPPTHLNDGGALRSRWSFVRRAGLNWALLFHVKRHRCCGLNGAVWMLKDGSAMNIDSAACRETALCLEEGGPTTRPCVAPGHIVDAPKEYPERGLAFRGQAPFSNLHGRAHLYFAKRHKSLR